MTEREEMLQESDQEEDKTVLNVRGMECRWVTDRVTTSGLKIFCGRKTTQPTRSYCDEHYKLVYVKTEKKSDNTSAVPEPRYGEIEIRR